MIHLHLLAAGGSFRGVGLDGISSVVYLVFPILLTLFYLFFIALCIKFWRACDRMKSMLDAMQKSLQVQLHTVDILEKLANKFNEEK